MQALDLAKYITTFCIEENQPISNLQLQKILYFIQKEFLMQKGRVAFHDDIEAWQFGPVVPNVYYQFCSYGSMPISMKYENTELESTDVAVINSLVRDKRKLDPWKLVEETHKPGGAWDRIYRNGAGERDIIPIELIKEVG